MLLMRWAFAEDDRRYEDQVGNGYWRESGDGMPPLPDYEGTTAFLNAWSEAANFPSAWSAADRMRLIAEFERRPPNLVQSLPTATRSACRC